MLCRKNDEHSKLIQNRVSFFEPFTSNAHNTFKKYMSKEAKNSVHDNKTDTYKLHHNYKII